MAGDFHWELKNILNPNLNNLNVVRSYYTDNIKANFKEILEVYVPNSFTPSNFDLIQ